MENSNGFSRKIPGLGSKNRAVKRYTIAPNMPRHQGFQKYAAKKNAGSFKSNLHLPKNFQQTSFAKTALGAVAACFVVATLAFVIVEVSHFIHNALVYRGMADVQTVQPNDVAKNKQLAAISKLFPLEEANPLVMGKIKDVNALKTQQPHLSKARNGDILVIYPDLTIAYDPAGNYIADIEKTELLQ